jgi:hypothetical protein
MNKFYILIIALISLDYGFDVFSQSFDEFYKHKFGLYTSYTTISTTSQSTDTLGKDHSIGYWGVLNIDGSISSSKQFGFSCTIKERQLSDLMFLLIHLFDKKNKKPFTRTDYISDFGFLPNIRFGLNILAQDKTIVNAGLAHSYYISEIEFIRNKQIIQQNNDWLCVGPNVYADRILTDWLAVRFGTGLLFSYANGKKVKENKPLFSESNFELFTSSGMFTGIDMLLFTGLKDDYSNYSITRFDFKFGYRF